MVRLLLRRREALGKREREPEFNGDGAVPIHWWELRAAGFATRRFEEPLSDEELGIKGRPWAILVRGTDCVPVLRMHGENEGLYANHYVRMAAYCHLIESSTNYHSPYGVILLPRRLDAMAVPNTDQVQAKLRGAVEIAEHGMAQFPGPDEPANDKICLRCPFAQPRKYVAGKSDTIYQGKELPPNSVRHNGVFVHTTCGDRFRWDPPTLKAIKQSGS